MNLEFKTYELKEDSIFYKRIIKERHSNNEFIVVGEEKLGEINCFKAIQLEEEGFNLIGGLTLDEMAFPIPKTDLKNKVDLGWEIQELNIPKDYLTVDIIENIKKLNEY